MSKPEKLAAAASLPSAVEIARADCRVCGGHGFVNMIPRDGGGVTQHLCGNCLEASRPPATTPFSFSWNDAGSIEDRAVALARSMAAVKCKNKYPAGVIGRQARAHYTEARHIAQAFAERERQQ